MMNCLTLRNWELKYASWLIIVSKVKEKYKKLSTKSEIKIQLLSISQIHLLTSQKDLMSSTFDFATFELYCA
jgi:hypothetical protein